MRNSCQMRKKRADRIDKKHKKKQNKKQLHSEKVCSCFFMKKTIGKYDKGNGEIKKITKK